MPRSVPYRAMPGAAPQTSYGTALLAWSHRSNLSEKRNRDEREKQRRERETEARESRRSSSLVGQSSQLVARRPIVASQPCLRLQPDFDGPSSSASSSFFFFFFILLFFFFFLLLSSQIRAKFDPGLSGSRLIWDPFIPRGSPTTVDEDKTCLLIDFVDIVVIKAYIAVKELAMRLN
ncbi:hypothetical protein TEA_004781 [Camellia sinensis var. sinensis]|uniref:Uncharacterized protein n=1 Tax=Camellia sinensis var. sinensis TaxID=542762 RepID=A0A4S4DNP1_CAMSN|nr:hypothetical protein TEA_004781 [Camellia sinensis var. sinensis]